MAGGVTEDPGVTQQLRLSQLIGNPAYFFDTKFLQNQLTQLAGWNQARLEAALAPRVDHIIGEADLRISANDGFYVVFGNPNPNQARDKTNAICMNIMKHFFGDAFTQDDSPKLCRPSSVQNVLDELGPSTSSQPGALYPDKTVGPASVEEPSESEGEKLLFSRELADLYRTSLDSNGDDFRFTPYWDSKQERITSFACEPAGSKSDLRAADPKAKGVSVASRYCQLDVMALASATKGVRHILSRGDVAAISTIVNVTTLSWSKTRSGYLDVLGRIEPQIRALLAPRIIGFDPGANLSAIAQWTTAMRGLVPWTFVHLPSLNFDFWRVGALGVRGIGVSVGTLSMPRNGLRALAAEADKLTRFCTSQRAIAYADNVASVKELKVLTSCGVRSIAGPVIGLPSELPGPVDPLSFGEVAATGTTPASVSA